MSLELDAERYEALTAAAYEGRTPAASLLRALITAAVADPELLESATAAASEEYRAYRRR